MSQTKADVLSQQAGHENRKRTSHSRRHGGAVCCLRSSAETQETLRPVTTDKWEKKHSVVTVCCHSVF